MAQCFNYTSRSLSTVSPCPDTPVVSSGQNGELSVSSATGASLSLLIHFRVIYKQVYHPPKGCTNPRADRCCQSQSKPLSPASKPLGPKRIVWSPQGPELCQSGAMGDRRVRKVKQVQAQSLWCVRVICYPARTDKFPSDTTRQMGGHSCDGGKLSTRSGLSSPVMLQVWPLVSNKEIWNIIRNYNFRIDSLFITASVIKGGIFHLQNTIQSLFTYPHLVSKPKELHLFCWAQKEN